MNSMGAEFRYSSKRENDHFFLIAKLGFVATIGTTVPV
jgi:hypothetical protein